VTDPAIDPATLNGLLEMTGGDQDFVDELVDTYIEDGQDQVAGLREAVTSGDDNELVRPAHSLKSSSLNIGALQLGALCRQLEEDSRRGSVADAEARVAAVARAFDEAREALLAERATRNTGGTSTRASR
jgi:HPt (histidine-containing phosphotransfer) domain-containing protein